jgi:hypothetical protein
MQGTEIIEYVCSCLKCKGLEDVKEEDKCVDWYDNGYEYNNYKNEGVKVGI